MTTLEEILQGMGGLDIDFSYEDGLRLSELSGQLARSEYMLDHIWTTNLWIFGFAATVSIALVVFYLMYAVSRIPAPGPISTIQSAARMVSSSCSTTMTEFPRSRRCLRVARSLSLSR